jgi:hypothetical protein
VEDNETLTIHDDGVCSVHIIKKKQSGRLTGHMHELELLGLGFRISDDTEQVSLRTRETNGRDN